MAYLVDLPGVSRTMSSAEIRYCSNEWGTFASSLLQTFFDNCGRAEGGNRDEYRPGERSDKQCSRSKDNSTVTASVNPEHGGNNIMQAFRVDCGGSHG